MLVILCMWFCSTAAGKSCFPLLHCLCLARLDVLCEVLFRLDILQQRSRAEHWSGRLRPMPLPSAHARARLQRCVPGPRHRRVSRPPNKAGRRPCLRPAVLSCGCCSQFGCWSCMRVGGIGDMDVQNFINFSSHQIFERIHKILNAAKQNN